MNYPIDNPERTRVMFRCFVQISLIIVSFTRLPAQEIDRSNLSPAYANTRGGEWTLGQLQIGDLEEEGSQILQGFLQKVFPISTALFSTENDQDIAVFPNPCGSHFQIKDIKNRELTIKIFDLAGKLQLLKSLNVRESAIDISKLVNGSYFLSIEKENQLLKTQILIKNQ